MADYPPMLSGDVIRRAITVLKRVGECKRCGQCCRTLNDLDVALSPEEEEWLNAHIPGATFKRDRAEEPTVGWLTIPCTCAQLIQTGPERYACGLQAERRPAICRDYPTEAHAADLYPGCGFGFVEVRGEPDEG